MTNPEGITMTVLATTLTRGIFTLALLGASFATGADSASYSIRSLNTPVPFFVVSGDGVTINVTAPSAALLARSVVKLNGRNVTSTLKPDATPGSLTGTVHGLRVGDNVLELFAHRGARAPEAQTRVTKALAPATDCSLVRAPVLSSVQNLVIESAALQPATDSLPEHCLVNGAINERIGVDGRPYAINFRLRMPAAWNERFYMGGGGGTNGTLVDPSSFLLLGFTTIGTDSGHNNTVNSDPNAGGAAAFGVDPQARIDFGYNSYDLVTQVGKAIVANYYGVKPMLSYFQGCSEGGREGLLMSQRFPHHYDGIISGDPVLHLPKGPMNGVWTTQIFAGLATRSGLVLANGDPALNRTYTDQDLLLVRNAILGVCDKLDGLVDGIVDNLPACKPAVVHPTLAALTCSGEKTASCLSADQIDSLKLAFDGPTGKGLVNSAGRQRYPNWPWDPGVSGQNGAAFNPSWRSWWLGSFTSATNNAIKLTFANALGVAYTQPPVLPFPQSFVLQYSLNFNFDTDYRKLFAKSGIYTLGARELWFTDSVDLSAFKRRSGKLMIYHGASDSSVSLFDTLNWYVGMTRFMEEREEHSRGRRFSRGRRDDDDSDESAQSFARLFPVPGMNHCSGGPATDRFDMLPQLMDWVENRVAPDSVIASATTPAYFGVAARSRPLCPYPKQARYKGAGDINEASNFTCETPRSSDRRDRERGRRDHD